MATQNIDYTLSIKVKKGVADLVRDDEYMPVVEILQDTPDLILTNDEKIEWVEVNKNTSSYPTVYNKDGGEPVFDQDDDASAGQFDIKFSAPKPDSKVIWFATQTHPLLGPDGGDGNGEGDQQDPANQESADNQEDADDTGYIEPVQLTQDDFGKVFLVDEAGEVSLIGVGDDHGVRNGDSIGIINNTRLSLFFWILSKDSTEPDLDVPYQTFEWLPGSGRIQLPPTAGKGLNVKVWLEAFYDGAEAPEGIKFQEQTQKTTVRYEDDVTDAEVMMSNLGLWFEEEEQPVQTTLSRRAISKTTSKPTAKTAVKTAAKPAAKPAWKGPPTLSSKASAKKRLTSNGTAVGRA